MQTTRSPGSYDWVDRDDKVVGHGVAHEAHTRNLYTRSVHILLENQRGELLICKRPETKKAYPNLYTSSAGGHVEEGESYTAAAIRELREELDISTPLTDAGRFDVVNETERAIHWLYVGKIESNVNLSTDPYEIGSIHFWGVDELWKNVTQNPKRYAPSFLKAFHQFLVWKGKTLYVLDFDHTVFDWYRFKKDLEQELVASFALPADIFRVAKDTQEKRDGLYHIERHLDEIATQSGIERDRITAAANKLINNLPEYIYDDARAFLKSLRAAQRNVVLLTYGDKDNQKLFVERAGVIQYFDSILYSDTKDGKVAELQSLLQEPHAVTFINDDPIETELIHELLPMLQKIYLIERSDAKYNEIPVKSSWEIVTALTEIKI